MNVQNEDKISMKEYASILMLCLGIKSTDSNPTLFYKSAMNAGWMLPIVSSFIVFVPLYCLMVVLRRYKDKNFIELLYHLLGRKIGFILSLIITLMAISSNASYIRNYTDIMTTIYFRRTPVIILASMLVFSSCVMAKLGIKAIGRTAWIVMPWILLIIGSFIILVYNLIKVDYLFPLGGGGVKQILMGGVTNSAVFADLIILSVFYPQIKNYKSFRNGSFFAFGYSVFILSLLCAIYLMVLDYPPIVINESPFHTVARLIFGGRFISNLEAFFFLFWIIGAIVRFSAYAYTNIELIGYTLRLKNSKKITTAVCALILMISLVPENYIENVIIFRKLILSFSWIFIYGVPCILLFASQRKGDYN